MANYIAGTTIQAPTARTAFEKIMPYEKIFNPTLIDQLATQQLKPELDRSEKVDRQNLWRNMAMSGAYRTGVAKVQDKTLADQYSRQFAEQKSQFGGQMNDWLTNWYNQQYDRYYRNPSAYVAPTTPTYDQYAANISSAYR